LKKFLAGDIGAAPAKLKMLGGGEVEIEKTAAGLTINRSAVADEMQISDDVTVYFVKAPIHSPPIVESTLVPAESMTVEQSGAVAKLRAKAAPSGTLRKLFDFARLLFVLRRQAHRALRPKSRTLSQRNPAGDETSVIECLDVLFDVLCLNVIRYFTAEVGAAAVPNAVFARLNHERTNIPELKNTDVPVIQSIVAHVNGMTKRIQGDDAAAMTWLSKAVELFPIDGWAWQNLGEVQLSAGALQQAETSFLQALMCLPQHRIAYRQLGRLASSHQPWLAATALFRAIALGVEVQYPIPTVIAAPPHRIYCGQYRNFDLYWNAGGYWLGYLHALGRCGPDNIARLVKPMNLAIGLAYTWKGRWRRFSYPLERLIGNPLAESLGVQAPPTAPSLKYRILARLSKWQRRILRILFKQIAPRPNLWEFAIVAGEYQQFLATIDAINDDWIYQNAPSPEPRRKRP